MDNKEGRVCKPCKNILERLAKAEEQQLTGGTGNDNSTGNGECFSFNVLAGHRSRQYYTVA